MQRRSHLNAALAESTWKSIAVDTEKAWKIFAKDNLPNKGAVLRKGSRFKKAEPWVNGVAGPAMPTQMMSNVEVFDSWLNPHNMKLAKEIVSHKKSVTLRGLVDEMFVQLSMDKTSLPYIWWIWPHSSKTRAIHQDANGITFVKLGNKWQMAYPIQAVGVLAGSQGSMDYENIPRNSYFVSWENEEIARQHIT